MDHWVGVGGGRWLLDRLNYDIHRVNGGRGVSTAADLRFEDITVGDQASFLYALTEQDIDQFAALSGDFNPLHVDEEYASSTPFGRRIVHGMFLASLLSRLVGMYLPGRRCLYLAQSLDFVHPVYVGDEVKILGEVQNKQDATRTLLIRTEIYTLSGQLAVRGKAHVKVLE